MYFQKNLYMVGAFLAPSPLPYGQILAPPLGRWDQQHDGVLLMVESICGKGFAYTREVEEDRQKI
jgi:hypothetical protein